MAVRFVLLSCALAAGTGCMPKSPSVPASVEEPASSGDALAVALSRMQAGAQTIMATPFGPESLVMVEGDYTSGLGQICRKATVRVGGTVQSMAACRDSTGWHTVEPIFENVQR